MSTIRCLHFLSQRLTSIKLHLILICLKTVASLRKSEPIYLNGPFRNLTRKILILHCAYYLNLTYVLFELDWRDRCSRRRTVNVLTAGTSFFQFHNLSYVKNYQARKLLINTFGIKSCEWLKKKGCVRSILKESVLCLLALLNCNILVVDIYFSACVCSLRLLFL